MWKEAILLALGCVLFVNMGLSDAVQETVGFHSRILSCPKCCAFWATLIYLIFSGCRIPVAVGASFLFSYLALWLDLGLSALNKRYNELYKQISAEADKAGPRPSRKRKRAKTDRPGVSEVQKQK